MTSKLALVKLYKKKKYPTIRLKVIYLLKNGRKTKIWLMIDRNKIYSLNHLHRIQKTNILKSLNPYNNSNILRDFYSSKSESS